MFEELVALPESEPSESMPDSMRCLMERSRANKARWRREGR